MSNLEALLKTYVHLVELWGKSTPGENCSRVWAASKFLEKQIKEEMKRGN